MEAATRATEETEETHSQDASPSSSSISTFRTRPIVQKPSDNCYNMNHLQRGYAYIFNNIDDGIDKERIGSTLRNLGFDVHSYEQLTYEEIVQVLYQASSMDHTDVDCFVVVVIAHGDNSGVEDKNGKHYYPDLLWAIFTSENCPTLTGKPKLFIIDSCRGTIVDQGSEIEFDGGAKPVRSFGATVKIPNMADFLIMFSTQAGHLGYGDDKIGSWFIHAFCNEVAKQHDDMDLLSILTCVNRSLAFEYEGTNLKNPAYHRTKQISSFVSSLTRFLYFT